MIWWGCGAGPHVVYATQSAGNSRRVASEARLSWRLSGWPRRGRLGGCRQSQHAYRNHYSQTYPSEDHGLFVFHGSHGTLFPFPFPFPFTSQAMLPVEAAAPDTSSKAAAGSGLYRGRRLLRNLCQSVCRGLPQIAIMVVLHFALLVEAHRGRLGNRKSRPVREASVVGITCARETNPSIADPCS